MSLTVAEGRDDILTVVKTAWDTTGFTMVYDDQVGSIPTTMVTWARTTVGHAGGGQATLSGSLGQQRYKRTGVVIVQIFTPSSEGLFSSDNSAKVIMDAFDGKSSENGVWFKNVRFVEVGPDGDFYQCNVLIDFEYDEIK